MKCRKCGNEVLEEFNVCPYCKEPIWVNQNVNNPNVRYLNSRNVNGSIGGIIALVAIIVGLAILVFPQLDWFDWTPGFDTYSKSGSGTTGTTSKSSSSTSIFSAKKNYEQIYDEYSQKLREAGPTSSISEMADILNEGVEKMAEYMYSAKGTDGQYATYEEWGKKLMDVYLEECR